MVNLTQKIKYNDFQKEWIFFFKNIICLSSLYAIIFPLKNFIIQNFIV